MTKRNENRPGYKETKVGWIPVEWECNSFGSIVRISQYGLSVSSSIKGTKKWLDAKTALQPGESKPMR